MSGPKAFGRRSLLAVAATALAVGAVVAGPTASVSAVPMRKKSKSTSIGAACAGPIAIRPIPGLVRATVTLPGDCTQVVPSALDLAFELVAAGTPVEGARLEIEPVPCEARCRACRTESRLTAFPFRCGACGGLDYEVTKGEELFVEALELEEAVSV